LPFLMLQEGARRLCMAQNAGNMSYAGIIENYGRMVTSICRRMIRDEESARDAAQEVWLEVIKSLPSFRGGSKLSTWIYTIACRVAMRCAQKERLYSTRYLSDYFRSGKRELPDHQDFDKAIWIKDMCDQCLTGILHCLDNEARIAYIFRDMAQLSYDEIGEILGRDPAAVRQIISRSRRKLKHFLENECALHNPNGRCACRMKKWVMDINLPQEYAKLRKTVAQVNVFKEAEEIMPPRNYWEQYL
jgi:RNA polymerase sigma-70 factor (ECF subfamily)